MNTDKPQQEYNHKKLFVQQNIQSFRTVLKIYRVSHTVQSSRLFVVKFNTFVSYWSKIHLHSFQLLQNKVIRL